MPVTPFSDYLVTSLEARNDRLFHWAEVNPRLFLSAGAAALVAPLFLKNDERGYFSTATLTTPVITAGAMIAPHLFPALSQQSKRFLDVVKQVPTNYGFRPAGVIDPSTLPQAHYNQHLTDFFSRPPSSPATPEQIRDEFRAVRSHFKKLYADPTKHRLLDNALYRARLDVSGAVDKLDWAQQSDAARQAAATSPLPSAYAAALAEDPGLLSSSQESIALAVHQQRRKMEAAGLFERPAVTEAGIPQVAPDWSVREIVEQFRTYKENPEWIRAMSYHLQHAAELETNLPPASTDISQLPQFAHLNKSEERPVQKISLKSSVARDKLRNAYPDAYSEIESLTKDTKFKLSDFELNILPAGRNRPVEEIVGLRVKRKLRIRLPNEHGGVRLGQDYQSLGVSRFFMTHEGPVKPHVYYLRNLRHGMGFVKKEQARGEFVIGRDKLDGRPAFTENGTSPANIRQQRRYARQGLMSNAPGAFPAGEGESGAWIDYDDPRASLRPESRLREFTHQLDHHNMTQMADTGMELLEHNSLRKIEPFGLQNASKESMRAKSLGKSVEAHIFPGSADPLHPQTTLHAGFSRTSVGNIPEVGVHTLQINDAQRALYGDLPEWEALAGDWAGQELDRDARAAAFRQAIQKRGHEPALLSYLGQETRGTQEDARAAWEKLSYFLMDRPNYEAMRSVAYLGEGSRLGASSIGARFQQIKNYTVHETLLESAEFGDKTPLGVYHGVPVIAHSPGARNTLIGWSRNEKEGTTSLQVRQELDIAGTKVGGLTKSTFSRELDDDAMARLRKGFSLHYEVTGQGGWVSDEVNSVIMRRFNSDKAGNPLQMLTDAIDSTLRRLEDSSARGSGVPRWLQNPRKEFAGRSYMDRFAEYGFSYQNGVFEQDARSMRALRRDAVLDAEGFSALARQMFEEVGTRIRQHKITGDDFMQGYLHWANTERHRRGSYFDYLTERALPESLSFSDHMNTARAESTKLTRDAIQQMTMFGHTDVTRELLHRIKTDGTTGLMADFLEHTDPSRWDPSKPFGEAVLSVQDAIGDSDLRLSTAEGRTMHGGREPTVFDPQHALAQRNYSVRAEVGGKSFFVPVPGRDAYGGKANAFGTDRYSPNVWERHLADVLESARAGTVSAEDFAGKLDTYKQSIRGNFGAGKKSVLRAEMHDPLGRMGRVTARTSQLRYADQSHNMYEIGVGKEYLETFSKAQQEMLHAGTMRAVAIRHPINAARMVNVKYDPTLDGTRMIGLDPKLMQQLRADSDGDWFAFHPVLKEAAAAAREIDDPGSFQARMGVVTAAFEGVETDPRAYHADALKSLWDTPGGEGQIGAFLSKDHRQSLIARTAGVDVGMLSNSFDLIETSLANNNQLRDPLERAIFHKVSFDVIRESSIAAKKLKAGNPESMLSLMAWNNQIRQAFDGPKRNFEAFYGAMERGAEKFGKTVPWQEALHGALGIARPESGQVNAYLDYVRTNRELFHKVWSGHTEEASRIQKLLTQSKEAAAVYPGDIIANLGHEVPGLRAMAMHGSISMSAANRSAAALGASNAGNAATRFARRTGQAAEGVTNQAFSALKEVVEAGKGHGAGKVLAVGAGLAAGAGILFGSLHSPREGEGLAPSGNQHRPEERIGAGDSIPGEGVAGAMAPSTPARTLKPAKTGVRTAVVAPIGRATQMEVRMRADDRGRAAEASKIVARLAAGDGNASTTIHYRDGARMNSLQARERIRETLQSDTP